MCLGKLIVFFCFWIFSVKFLGSRQGKHRHVCQNWILSLQRKFFEEKKTENFLFVFFLDFGETFSKFQLITWGNLCRNCLVSVQMNHLGKKLHNFFSSVMMSRKNSELWHKKTARLLKLHSTSTQEHFEERSWHVLVFFGAWVDFFYKFRPKTWGKSVGTPL